MATFVTLVLVPVLYAVFVPDLRLVRTAHAVISARSHAGAIGSGDAVPTA